MSGSGKVRSRKFNGLLYRLMQHFPYKAVAASYAKGLRKRGLDDMNPDVLVRVTKERDGWYVWARGKR